MLPHSKDIQVVVLSNKREHVAHDKTSLSRLGYRRVNAFALLGDAERFVGEHQAQAALVDSTLDDASGLDAVRRIRIAGNGCAVPTVMVTNENRKGPVLSAIAAGINGYVLRPYSLDTLGRHLRVAFESLDVCGVERELVRHARGLVEQGRYEEAIGEFEEVVSEENEAEKHFRIGMEHMGAHRYGKAIVSFNRAVRLNELYAEAYKGLADAHKGAGDAEAYRKFLAKAADIYALQDRFEETRELFAEILNNEPDAVNPYNSLGVELRKQGDYVGALHAYNQALALTPMDEHIHFNIAKAHSYAGNRGKAVEHLRRAVEINPEFRQARDLFHQLGGEGPIGADAGTAARDGAPSEGEASATRLDLQ